LKNNQRKSVAKGGKPEGARAPRQVVADVVAEAKGRAA